MRPYINEMREKFERIWIGDDRTIVGMMMRVKVVKVEENGFISVLSRFYKFSIPNCHLLWY